jgi:hypothetical protein
MNATFDSGENCAEPLHKGLAAALRKTTETLASELAHPSNVAPDWSDFEWLVARAVAAMHGVSPLLSRVLRWQGPAGWAEFLADQRHHTESRYQRIRELLLLLDQRARHGGIAILSLKGAALHTIGIYVAGERPMADVDLLVREEDAQRTVQMLQALGFDETHTMWKHIVFEPSARRVPVAFGENCSNDIKIELHTRIIEILPRRIADVSDLVFPERPHPGLNDYKSNASLMIHLLLHAAGAMVARAVRLLNLHDVAQLAAHMTDRDWDEVLLCRNSRREPFWWAYPPLALTARYYGSIPDRILAALAADCPWTLRQICRRRTLSDVSFSYLWVSAFPGIEWTLSVREMLVYAAQRVAPGAEVRALRTVIARTQPFAAGSSWNHMSQSRRILRWMTSRQARAETLHPVRMALAQRP